MQIYIMRHGEATPQNFSSLEGDSLRALTEKGCIEVKRTAQWLVDKNEAAYNIFVSPYLRAQQTGQYIVETLSTNAPLIKIELETFDGITPEGSAQQVHDFIDGVVAAGLSDSKAILFISHMPFVSFLVAQLTNSQNTPIFATGAVAHIDYNVKRMQGKLLEIYTSSND